MSKAKNHEPTDTEKLFQAMVGGRELTDAEKVFLNTPEGRDFLDGARKRYAHAVGTWRNFSFDETLQTKEEARQQLTAEAALAGDVNAALEMWKDVYDGKMTVHARLWVQRIAGDLLNAYTAEAGSRRDSAIRVAVCFDRGTDKNADLRDLIVAVVSAGVSAEWLLDFVREQRGKNGELGADAELDTVTRAFIRREAKQISDPAVRAMVIERVAVSKGNLARSSRKKTS